MKGEIISFPHIPRQNRQPGQAARTDGQDSGRLQRIIAMAREVECCSPACAEFLEELVTGMVREVRNSYGGAR